MESKTKAIRRFVQNERIKQTNKTNGKKNKIWNSIFIPNISNLIYLKHIMYIIAKIGIYLGMGFDKFRFGYGVLAVDREAYSMVIVS